MLNGSASKEGFSMEYVGPGLLLLGRDGRVTA
jgi:hypothetical protein